MTNTMLSFTTGRGSRTSTLGHRKDRGNVLPMVLVMMVVGSLMVTALLTFAMTLLRNRPPLEERSDSLEAVRSAMRMAIVMQRDHGPEGCYQASNPGFDVNGRSVSIQCQVLEFLGDNGGRFGLIATTNNGLGNGTLPNNEAVRTGAGNTVKEVLGSVFLNGGQLGGNNAGLKLVDGQLIGSTYSSTTTSPNRYSQIDINTDLTYPVGTTCASLFGPATLQQSFSNGPLVPPASMAVAPLKSSYLLPSNVRVERLDASSNTMILGVMVKQDAATVRLDRSPTDVGNGRFDVSIPLLMIGEPVVACYQSVPATDPTYIPRGLTTCNGPLVNPEVVGQSATAGNGITCEDTPWWNYAGWKPQLLDDYIYPMLPQVPSYPRSSTPVQVGPSNCYIFYPGRYNSPINLVSGRNYYFASGVYLLNNTMTVQPDAQVVAGEGTYKGCAFDADAAFLSGSPLNHEITGKGVTFLLGSNVDANSAAVPTTNGRIVVNSGSLRVNRRVATTSTRASAGLSVMSVNLARTSASPADVEIPANDRVLLPSCLASEVAAVDADVALNGGTNPCATDVASYTITPTAAIGDVRFTKSGLGPNDVIISATLNGTDRNANRVLFGGTVFVPNSKVVMTRAAATDDYAVRLGNGAVASSFNFNFAAGNDTNFLIGQETETTYQRVRLIATTVFNGQDFRSVAELEVDAADRYAINNWTVDAGSGDLTGGAGGSSTGGDEAGSDSGSTTTLPTTPTTTVPSPTTTVPSPTTTVPSPTTTVPSPTTTVPSPTTTVPSPTTTVPSPTTTVPTPDPCVADTTWTAQWWNNRTLSGAPVVVNNPIAIANNWGSGVPTVNGSAVPGINADNFSVRWTRKIKVSADGNYQFYIGADDGYRFKVDGGAWLTNSNRWSDHSYQDETVVVPLTAGCAHTIVFEYYENSGTATANFSWNATPMSVACPNTQTGLWEGRYYNDTNETRARNDWRSYQYTQDTATIDFNWGYGSPNQNQLGNDTFSIRWTQIVNLPQTGTYEFEAGGNNGYRLYVNGTQVIDDWGNGGFDTRTGQINITNRCNVELVFEYYENTQSAQAWFGPWTRIN